MRRWSLALLLAAGCEPANVAAVPEVAAPALTPPVTPTVEPAPVFLDIVPADPTAMRGWLLAFAYRGWAPQTDIRATGEHGGERLYFNRTLAASWQAGAQEHPVGSAAVRELYEDDLKTLKGFAVMHKIGPSGPTGEGWFWYEIFGADPEAEPTVAQTAARGCVGCHSHAVDFVHSPATPRVDPPRGQIAL